MALPLKSWFTIFDAIAATATSPVPGLGVSHPEHANSIILEVVGAATPSWTLDIQGRSHPDGTYLNWDYQQIQVAGAAALSVAQLSITDTTRRFYLIPNCPAYLQLIATRTTGTLTVRGCYTSEVFSQWLLTTARGSVFIEGPTASDVAEAGNPVQIGGSVDDTTPVAATEGDVRRVRVTPEGNLYAELLSGTTELADTTGLKIQGVVASDVAEAGNPVQIGGSVDDTAPAAATEGDVRRVRVTPEGNMIAEPYRDNTSLFPVPAALADSGSNPTLTQIEVFPKIWSAVDSTWSRFRDTRGLATGSAIDGLAIPPVAMLGTNNAATGMRVMRLVDGTSAILAVATRGPTAGAVLSIVVDVAATSASRQTLITPTLGKAIRIISVQVVTRGLTTNPDRVGVYFDSGIAYTTTTSKAIAEFVPGTTGQQSMSWPDGAGPVGAVDVVVSGITETETELTMRYTIHYREE